MLDVLRAAAMFVLGDMSTQNAAMENFNGQFKSIFQVTSPVPTKGAVATQRYAVLVYQLALLYRFKTSGSLRAGL